MKTLKDIQDFFKSHNIDKKEEDIKKIIKNWSKIIFCENWESELIKEEKTLLQEIREAQKSRDIEIIDDYSSEIFIINSRKKIDINEKKNQISSILEKIIDKKILEEDLKPILKEINKKDFKINEESINSIIEKISKIFDIRKNALEKKQKNLLDLREKILKTRKENLFKNFLSTENLDKVFNLFEKAVDKLKKGKFENFIEYLSSDKFTFIADKIDPINDKFEESFEISSFYKNNIYGSNIENFIKNYKSFEINFIIQIFFTRSLFFSNIVHGIDNLENENKAKFNLIKNDKKKFNLFIVKIFNSFFNKSFLSVNPNEIEGNNNNYNFKKIKDTIRIKFNEFLFTESLNFNASIITKIKDARNKDISYFIDIIYKITNQNFANLKFSKKTDILDNEINDLFKKSIMQYSFLGDSIVMDSNIKKKVLQKISEEKSDSSKRFIKTFYKNPFFFKVIFICLLTIFSLLMILKIFLFYWINTKVIYDSIGTYVTNYSYYYGPNNRPIYGGYMSHDKTIFSPGNTKLKFYYGHFTSLDILTLFVVLTFFIIVSFLIYSVNSDNNIKKLHDNNNYNNHYTFLIFLLFFLIPIIFSNQIFRLIYTNFVFSPENFEIFFNSDSRYCIYELLFFIVFNIVLFRIILYKHNSIQKYALHKITENYSKIISNEILSNLEFLEEKRKSNEIKDPKIDDLMNSEKISFDDLKGELNFDKNELKKKLDFDKKDFILEALHHYENAKSFII